MGSMKIPIDVSIDGATKVIFLTEGMSWGEICKTTEAFIPWGQYLSHFILLDPDGDEYSAPLDSEILLWKIATTYGKAPGFTFKALLTHKADANTPPTASAAISAEPEPSQHTFPVCFHDVIGNITVALDSSWKDLAQKMSEAVSAAGVVSISHVSFIDDDGDELSSKVSSAEKFWRVSRKITSSYTIKIYGSVAPKLETSPYLDETSDTAVVPDGTAAMADDLLISFGVVFRAVHCTVSVPVEAHWDELVARMRAAVPVADSAVISHVLFVDEDGDILSSKVDSASKFWRFVQKLNTSFCVQLCGSEPPSERDVMPPEETSSINIPVFFKDSRTVLSVTKDTTWNEFKLKLETVVGADPVDIARIDLLDENGKFVKSNVTSVSELWSLFERVPGSIIYIRDSNHGNFTRNGSCEKQIKKQSTTDDMLKICSRAREVLSGTHKSTLDNELWNVCTHGHVSEIAALIKRGASVISENINGSSAIHFAAISGDIETTALLLSLGCNIHACNKKGFSALHFAVSKGNVQFILYLLSRGADIYKETMDGYSPLSYICGRGVPGMFSTVHRTEAFDVNHLSSAGVALLHMICGDSSMNPLLVDELLDLGADIELEDSDKRTPLLAACFADNTAAAQILLRRGALPNVKDRSQIISPLLLACGNENFGLVVGLVERGANVSSIDEDGNSALHIAVGNGNSRIVKYLLEVGATENLMNKKGQRPLDIAFAQSDMAMLTVLKRFKGPLDRATIFLNACADGDASYVENFILSGSDPKLVLSHDMSSGMHVACAAGRVDVASSLANAGISLDDRNLVGLTPFLIACEKGHTSILELLSHHGADVNQSCLANGNTGLHSAVIQKHDTVLSWLLQHGADRSIRNTQGQTPLSLAESRGNKSAKAILSGERAQFFEDVARKIPILKPAVPVVNTIFDDLMLSFSCISDSSQVTKTVEFHESEDEDEPIKYTT